MSFDLLAATLFHPTMLAVGPLQTGLIGTLIIGFLCGLVAKLLTGDRNPTGCFITIIIGIVGAYLALFIGQAIGHYQTGEAPGFVASVIGAILLLAIYHFITRRSGGPKI